MPGRCPEWNSLEESRSPVFSGDGCDWGCDGPGRRRSGCAGQVPSDWKEALFACNSGPPGWWMPEVSRLRMASWLRLLGRGNAGDRTDSLCRQMALGGRIWSSREVRMVLGRHGRWCWAGRVHKAAPSGWDLPRHGDRQALRPGMCRVGMADRLSPFRERHREDTSAGNRRTGHGDVVFNGCSRRIGSMNGPWQLRRESTR